MFQWAWKGKIFWRNNTEIFPTVVKNISMPTQEIKICRISQWIPQVSRIKSDCWKVMLKRKPYKQADQNYKVQATVAQMRTVLPDAGGGDLSTEWCCKESDKLWILSPVSICSPVPMRRKHFSEHHRWQGLFSDEGEDLVRPAGGAAGAKREQVSIRHYVSLNSFKRHIYI